METPEFDDFFPDFLDGYMKGMVFANVIVFDGDEDTNMLSETEFKYEVPPPSIEEEAEEDCREFVSENLELLVQASGEGMSAEQAGIDFSFSRNGHGSGFFAHRWEDRELGKKLQEAAEGFGTQQILLYVTRLGDDGKDVELEWQLANNV